MRPEEQDILIRAFRVQTVSELAAIVHDSKRSVQYVIDSSKRAEIGSALEQKKLNSHCHFLLSLLTNVSSFIETGSPEPKSLNKPKRIVLVDDDELITYRVA